MANPDRRPFFWFLWLDRFAAFTLPVGVGYALVFALGGGCWSCSGGRARAGAVVRSLPGALSTAGTDSSTMAGSWMPAPPVAPVPPGATATAAQSRRYVRQMAAYTSAVAAAHPAGPRKVKLMGSSAYAAPGAHQTAATGTSAAAADGGAGALSARAADQVAPVLGEGNRVKLAHEEAMPFPWWAVVALAGLGGYLVFRTRHSS